MVLYVHEQYFGGFGFDLLALGARKMKDENRQVWVLNTPFLYQLFRRSNYRSALAFAKAHRKFVDKHVELSLADSEKNRLGFDRELNKMYLT